jgi:hypothetical protein
MCKLYDSLRVASLRVRRVGFENLLTSHVKGIVLLDVSDIYLTNVGSDLPTLSIISEHTMLSVFELARILNDE